MSYTSELSHPSQSSKWVKKVIRKTRLLQRLEYNTYSSLLLAKDKLDRTTSVEFDNTIHLYYEPEIEEPARMYSTNFLVIIPSCCHL